MLKYYVRRSAVEAFEEVKTQPKRSVWIHGDEVAEHELAQLADTYGFDLNLIRDVLNSMCLFGLPIKASRESYLPRRFS